MSEHKPTILFSIEADEVWRKIRELLQDELQKVKPLAKEVSYETPGLFQKPVYKAAEVCTMLQISRQTLHLWVKEGILRAYKIKSRVFFLWADIEKLIQKEPQ
jgi:hypothetical protein